MSMSLFRRDSGIAILTTNPTEPPPHPAGRITLDQSVPEGIDTEHWPPGWADTGSDFWVPVDHRPWYRREAPGSDWERGLLDYWDSRSDPRNIDIAWKEDSGAPRAERLNRFKPDDHDLLRHIGALSLGYAAWVKKVNAEATAQRIASWTCQAPGCGRWDFVAEPHNSPGVPPAARLCPECRAVAARLATDQLGEDIMADGRTRREAVADWLGVTA